ncbi:MAG: hypothetical protein ACPHID_07395 [Thermoplasmatota archaeon]
MKPTHAWLLVVVAATILAGSLLLPPAVLAASLLVALASLRRQRITWWIFAATTLLVNALLMWWLADDIRLGVDGALRLSVLVCANASLAQRIPLAAFLDGLRLGPRPTSFLAAVLLSTRDVGHDAQTLIDVQRLEGRWPRDRIGQARAAARLTPGMFLASTRHARIRQEALRGAGLDVPARFAPILAVTALAIAGRLAFLALPNVALTYAVVFLGGVLFGGRVGFWAGFWAMALTDLALTGLAPTSFVNAPAMGVLGLLGGWSQQLGADRWTQAWAAALGIVGTFLFSALTDVATWLMVPEFRTTVGWLQVRILAGLAFNVVPAVTNAVLFAAAILPIQRARAVLPQ